MKNFITAMFALLAFIVLQSIASAQPLPPPGPYYVVERCYTVLFPYPHSRCEYVRVRRNYTPVPPPLHRMGPPPPHHMGPPPMGPRPGHHPPPPGGHNHNHGPRR